MTERTQQAMAESVGASSSPESSREESLSESSATDQSYSSAYEEEDDSASDDAIEPYMYEPIASDSDSGSVEEEESRTDERLRNTNW